MRRVIGIGETILDILFRDGQPQAAVPGGSVYNGMISLGRLGVDVTFICETGNDKVGEIIRQHMQENGLSTEYVQVSSEGKSPISLAFLNTKNDAEYVFYKDYSSRCSEISLPKLTRDDIVMIGSYFAVSPVLRHCVKELLDEARGVDAMIYYDVNFRRTHAAEAMKLMPSVLENFEYADILRGSTEDFYNLFGMTDAARIYRDKVAFYCQNFICTDAANEVKFRSVGIEKDYPVEPITTVSTVGAGDNFNAGIVYALIQEHIRRADLPYLLQADWNRIISMGMRFSAEVCQSVQNSVSVEFAEKLLAEKQI